MRGTCAGVFSDAALGPLCQAVPSEMRWHTWGPIHICKCAYVVFMIGIFRRIAQNAPEQLAEVDCVRRREPALPSVAQALNMCPPPNCILSPDLPVVPLPLESNQMGDEIINMFFP